MTVLVGKRVRENLRSVRQDRREVTSATSLSKSRHNVELWQATSLSVDACALACVPAADTASLVR
jgi:phage gp37-like protein